MEPAIRLTPEFVDSFPNQLENGKIYVSVKFASATHKCCCGCGMQVVTPISPVGWRLIFDGETVSLEPSIGNWSFKCKSHYWITHGRVIWADEWSKDDIDALRKWERKASNRVYVKQPVVQHTLEKRTGKGTILSRLTRTWTKWNIWGKGN